MSIRIHIENTRLRLFDSAEGAREYARIISFTDEPWEAVEFDCGWLIRNPQGVYRDDDGIIPRNIAAIIDRRLKLTAALAGGADALAAQGFVPVTLWSRKNEQGDWEFNHLEDGHIADDAERPTPKHENHKTAWRKGAWHAHRAFLSADVPPRVIALPG